MAHKILRALGNVGGSLIVIAAVMSPFAGLALWIVGWHEAARWSWAGSILCAGFVALACVLDWLNKRQQAQGESTTGG